MERLLTTTRPHDLAERTAEGRVDFRPHPGQWRAWQSVRRYVVVLAGSQGGKTSFGPHWLYREIQRRGPGDYLVVTPTFQLLGKKLLPEFRRLFERWLQVGRYVESPSRVFRFSPEGEVRTHGYLDTEHPTTIWFGYAEDPESLESATVKAAWLDEAGQRRFRLESWEAIQRRLAIHQGRVLVTTTPYDLGWLKQKLFDPWKAGHSEIDVIRFDSTENPLFPQAEYERAKRDLPAWKFDLFYRAIFTRPAGLIYDSYLDEPAPTGHLVPRFVIPRDWPRYLGLDFGGVNTAGLFYAGEMADGRPTERLYLYRTYKAGGRTAGDHAEALLKGEPMVPVCVGGSHSEDQWRQEFRQGGLPVMEPPIKDVEVGIDRVYGAHKRGEILVFDDLVAYREEKTTYSRELNEMGEPTEKIADKSSFHYCDAERYLISHLRGGMVIETDTALYEEFWNRSR
jgi:hypothetical protein